MQNAGSRFQRTFADEPLLERLRILPREDTTDAQVKKKAKELYIQWASAYAKTPGLSGIANLFNELPKSQRPQAARQKVLRDTEHAEPPDAATPSHSRTPSAAATPSSSSKPVTNTPLAPLSSASKDKSRKDKRKSGAPRQKFELAKEKDKMTACIAQSSIACTNLMNGLKLIDREKQRPSEDPEVKRRFNECRSLRKRILYYIHHVESDDWIGSLVNANDVLVEALIAFEINDRSIDEDSDSDGWEGMHEAVTKSRHEQATDVPASQIANLSLKGDAPPPPRPPRPGNLAMPAAQDPKEDSESEYASDEDENDPFGDKNAAPTPAVERGGMTWREV